MAARVFEMESLVAVFVVGLLGATLLFVHAGDASGGGSGQIAVEQVEHLAESPRTAAARPARDPERESTRLADRTP
ncbi:hypothetical protein [Marinivivus vitaminiproducens]|uniref:hypothetical protein n=1 Tax=Marinivivus vitaminiproducens TaxID=3035935 RepID=UPI0027A0D881|nr:hypothetical protein P4R82_22280 [Geminicoccaceae bacterium SCSIO 64248]